MNINVTRTEVIVGNGYIVNKGEYKINPCEFTFSEEYTVNLVKKAVFDDGKTTKEMAIINNKCDIPYEVLDSDSFELRVYAYRVNGEELELVYSPTPAIIYLREGSYRGVTGSGEIITPTQYEQYEQALNDGLDDLEAGLQEVSNVDIDVSKNGNTATVTITDRQGTEKSVEIFDGDDYVLTEEDKQEIINTVEAEVSLDIPTNVSQLENDSGFIDKDVNNLTNYYKKSETYTKQEIDEKISSVYKYKGTVASYNNLPSTGLTIGDVYNVEDTGDNYAWTGTDWDKLGGDIDLSGYYTKNETDTLLGAKQNTINAQNKLNSDLVDDTNHTNKFVTASEKNTWNAKYTKPSGGIPKTDLESSVQTSLGKADTALQEEDLQDLETQVETIEEDLYGEIDAQITSTPAVLTGTKEGRDLSIKKIYGNTPSQETREGYNLLPSINTSRTINEVDFTKNNDGSITCNGTSTDVTIYRINSNTENAVLDVPLEAGNYILSDDVGDYTNYFIQLTDYTTYANTGSGGSVGKASFTLSNSSNVGAWIYIRSGVTLNNVTFNPMIVKGTTEKDYEQHGASPSPNFESPVKVVDGEYEILAENKNLAKFEIDNFFRRYQDGKLSENSDFCSYIARVFPNKNYYAKNVHSNLAYYDLDMNYIGGISFANGGSFNTNNKENVGYVSVAVEKTKKNSVIINEGSTTIEYITHAEQTVSIDTSPNPLYSENDCYKYLTSEQATALGLNTGAGWYCYNEWTKVRLSSQQTWYKQEVSVSGKNRYYTIDFDGIFKPASATSNIGNVKSNYYKAQSGNSSWAGNEGIGLSTSNALFINDNNYLDNLAGWKTWLDSVNCYAYFELATPTNTKITNANLINSLNAIQELKQYEDTTIITISDIYKFDLAYDGDRVEVLLDDVANLKSGKEDKSNKTGTLNSSSTEEQYPNAKGVYDKIKVVDDNVPYFETKRATNDYNREDGYKNWYVDSDRKIIASDKSIMMIASITSGRHVFRIDNCADIINLTNLGFAKYSNTSPQVGDTVTDANIVINNGSVYGVINQPNNGYAIIGLYFSSSTYSEVNKYADILTRHLVIAPVASGYVLPYTPYNMPVVGTDNLANNVQNKLKDVSDYWRGKTIWWCGTSIPEGKDQAIGSESNGKSYPEMVGEILGANVINKALGSSMCRANVRTGDYVDALSYNLVLSLSQTAEEKQYLIDNWSTIRQSLHDPNTYESLNSIASTVIGASFESRLMPYLDGTYSMPDLFVIDHGHNDWKSFYTMPDETTPDTELQPTVANITNNILAEDTYMTANNNAKLISLFGEISAIPSANRASFIASINRNCFIGAINFICTLILSKNPRARIVFIGNLDNWAKPQVQPAQESIAESWEFPLIKMWEYTGFSNHFIPNTATFWDNSGTVDLMMKQIYCKDNTHPHSDTTGQAMDIYAEVIAEAIKKIR